MKDNLLPFDLEEAKKDPSRIRHMCDLKARVQEFYFFTTGHLTIKWNDELSPDIYNSVGSGLLRLTPKRIFVRVYKETEGHYKGVRFISEIKSTDEIEAQAHEVFCKTWDYQGKFELIPVKEDE